MTATRLVTTAEVAALPTADALLPASKPRTQPAQAIKPQYTAL